MTYFCTSWLSSSARSRTAASGWTSAHSDTSPALAIAVSARFQSPAPARVAGAGLHLLDQAPRLGELALAALTHPGEPVAVAGELEADRA